MRDEGNVRIVQILSIGENEVLKQVIWKLIKADDLEYCVVQNSPKGFGWLTLLL